MQYFKHSIVAAALAIVAPQIVNAQTCDILRSITVVASNPGTANQTVIIQGGEIKCPGGKVISANTIGQSEAAGIITLEGNVSYRDADRIVTAESGQYYKRLNLLQARGNVVVTDAKTGSRLTGPALDYYQVSATQKVSRVLTSQGRSRAVMKQKRNSPTGPATVDSSIVDADVIEILGERTFRGTGNAMITRADVRGFGNFAEYNQDTGNLLLAQAARVEGDKYSLRADSITAVAPEGEKLKEIRARHNSLLTAEQVRVESPFLRIYLDSGKVNRLVATRPTASRNGTPVTIPSVRSATFNVSADSIDALAPNQQLKTVDAVGHAYGERIDTLPPPAVAKELPNVLAHDWLRGDTLHATFVENPDAPRDTAGNRERMLQQIVAIGKQASSAIRMPQPNDTTYRIYYTLADLITVDFAKGAVLKVDLKGNVHGVFLSPQSAAVATRKTGGS